MKYLDGSAFRAAIEARLRQDASDDQDLARRRRLIAFDRFLARLAVTEHQAWVLKGGAALEFRMPDRVRSTRDVDLALAAGVDPTDLLLDDLAEDPFGDHFSFGIIKRKTLADNPDRGPILRLTLEAHLAGRVFERFMVDIVSAPDGVSAAERVELGNLLHFAGVPIVEIAVVDLRTHFAEKLSAYLRRYDDRPNTRVKDLVDLALLIEGGLASDHQLYATITATFTQRQQALPGDVLPSMADEWAESYAAMAAEVGVCALTSVEAHRLAEQFWCELLEHSPDPNQETPEENN